MEPNEVAYDNAKRAADEATKKNLPTVLTNNTIKSICKQTSKRTHKR